MSTIPLWTRLVVAIVVPLGLVTLTLTPILASHLDEQVDSTSHSAEALLGAEYDMLLQGMNESFNQVLATAEFPLLRQFLIRRTTPRPPE
ncbi:hypothetical protein [Halomonas marinisediminis]|uniref:hypothetical protein n=1 Tax=Halomonas marinisediminis TaxID=2546095 RepID=UPI00197A81F0|nr:hypothetical protein [Halomonas marinisediminis]